jgi:hypothetical protein
MRCHISTLARDDYFLSADSYHISLYKVVSKGVYEAWFPEANSRTAVLYYTQNSKVEKLFGTDVVIVNQSDINRCNGGQISVHTSLVEHFLRNYPQDAEKVLIFRHQDPFIYDNQTSNSSSANSSMYNNSNSRNFSSGSCNSILSNGRDISTKSSNYYRSQFNSSTKNTVNQRQFPSGSSGSSQASSSSDSRRNNADSTDNPVRNPRSQVISYSSISESDKEFLKKNSGGALIGGKKRDNETDQNAPNKLSVYTSLFQMKNKADVSFVPQSKKQKRSLESSSSSSCSSRNVIDLLDDEPDETENTVEPEIEAENLYMKHHFIVVKRLLDEKVILCKVRLFISCSEMFCFSMTFKK